MMITKANEYLIAVGFLFAFSGFWAFLFRNSGRKRHE
jgi:hypothetical protein